MTDYPIAQNAYNAAGKPFQTFNLFRFKVTRRDNGTTANFYFSDRRKTETITVQDPSDNSDSSRVYVGGKHIIRVPPIKDTQGLTVDIHEIELSFISPQIKDMIYDHYMAGGYFEWHQAQADRRNGNAQIARPVCEMFGVIHDVRERHSGKDKKTAQRSSVFIVTVSGRHAEFEDSNNAFRSYEEGLKRDGDKIFEFVESVADWPIGWGKEIHRHRDHGNKGKKKDERGGSNTGDSHLGGHS